MIVKHANPCGVAIGATIEAAYDKALASDPISAYGGIVVLNRAVDGALGAKLAEQFVEVLFAPGYSDDALAALQERKNIRILVDHERRGPEAGDRHYKRVLGGMLVQDPDSASRSARAGRSSPAPSPSACGATSSSRGASASTSPRTRSCWPRTSQRSGSAPAR